MKPTTSTAKAIAGARRQALHRIQRHSGGRSSITISDYERRRITNSHRHGRVIAAFNTAGDLVAMVAHLPNATNAMDGWMRNQAGRGRVLFEGMLVGDTLLDPKGIDGNKPKASSMENGEGPSMAQQQQAGE